MSHYSSLRYACWMVWINFPYFLEFIATRIVLKFNTIALAADQPGFAKNLKMLGEAGFGQRHIVNVEERGAIPTLPLHEVREDADTHGIGQSKQYARDGDLRQGRVIERPRF